MDVSRGFWMLLIILIVTFCGWLECNSRFSMIIKEYRKESFRRLDGLCCGTRRRNTGTGSGNFYIRTESFNCMEPCVQRFRICLEYAQAAVNLTDIEPYQGPCAYGSTITDVWGRSDLKFETKYSYPYNFDVNGPWPGQILIIIEAYDTTVGQEIYQRALIDRFIHKTIIKPSPARSLKSQWHSLTKQNGGASIYRLNFQLVCRGGYYGDSCNKYCVAPKDNSVHYKCDETNGDKICNEGWMGPVCNTTVCKPGCHPIHGYCPEPGQCKCTEGWKGPFCDECIKYPGCKHGTCIDSPWTCYCEQNWAGQFCDKSLNFCAENNPCKNGGICENLPSDSKPYKCICPSGFNGTHCEIDRCYPNPCHKGTCLKTKDDFYCQCFDGWIGKFCDKDSRACDPSSCHNGGQCQLDVHGNWRCLCPVGYHGSECHLADPCHDINSKCRHATNCLSNRALGTVVMDIQPQHHICNCQKGWTGQFCDINIDDCVKNPCLNGGQCEDGLDSYQCKCKEGFKGRLCEINVACQSKPCLNGGVCKETEEGFECTCKKGYSGNKCQIYKTGCSPNPCRNGAYCYTIDQDFYCQCKSEYWGKKCEYQRPICNSNNEKTISGNSHFCSGAQMHDACSLPALSVSKKSVQQRHICGLYGTCLPSINSAADSSEQFTCKCMLGFHGDRCQYNVDDCTNNPCTNGGVCIDGVNDFQCICPTGFHGKRCELREEVCSKNPCMHGGLCKVIQSSTHTEFQCTCSGGWAGRLCHLPSQSVCQTATGDPAVCMNSGSCIANGNADGGFICQCPRGWLGLVCQIKHPEAQLCRDNQCRNNGVCYPVGDNNFGCQCPLGYEGKYCEININECHPNPCYNGGKCKDMINSYKCECPKGFVGSNCQTNYDDCTDKPCAYGSICVDRIAGFECRCPIGRHGRLCDQVVNNVPPRPPSCVFENRIFDSGQVWTYNCQQCRCDTGKIHCKKLTCGVWSCLKANGPEDPYACKSTETCHAFHYDETRCFVPPCQPKALCLKHGDPVPPVYLLWPPPTSGKCQPNNNYKNNFCAKIILTFEKKNLPVGVTVDDLCDEIKRLPIVRSYRNSREGQSLSISCDIVNHQSSIINIAIYSSSSLMMYLATANSERPFVHFLADKIADSVIDVVSHNYSVLSGLLDIRVETLLNPVKEDNSEIVKYMLIPIIIVGLLFLLLIIWHHKRSLNHIRFKNNEMNSKNQLNNNIAAFTAHSKTENFNNQKLVAAPLINNSYYRKQASSAKLPPPNGQQTHLFIDQNLAVSHNPQIRR